MPTLLESIAKPDAIGFAIGIAIDKIIADPQRMHFKSTRD
jgi:hypothetical protein